MFSRPIRSSESPRGQRFTLRAAEAGVFSAEPEEVRFQLLVLRRSGFSITVIFTAEQTHMLESTCHARAGDLLAGNPFRMPLAQRSRTACRHKKPVRRLNTVVLPAPLGPIQRHNFPLTQFQRALLTASKPPKASSGR